MAERNDEEEGIEEILASLKALPDCKECPKRLQCGAQNALEQMTRVVAMLEILQGLHKFMGEEYGRPLHDKLRNQVGTVLTELAKEYGRILAIEPMGECERN